MKAPQIFLSYVREDEPQVKELYRKLAGAGYNPWMDTENLIPGERWKNSIMRALKQSDFVLVCLSSTSVKKRGFFWKEVRHALEQLQEKLEDDIYIIPVRLDDCQPPEIFSKLQWADLFKEVGWRQLVSAIQAGVSRLAADRGKKDVEPGMEIDNEEAFRSQVWERLVPEQISITSPPDGSRVAWRPYVTGTVTNPNAQVRLTVHPMEVSGHWVQPAVNVKEDGSWGTVVFLGQAGGRDIGKRFEIVAVANPKDNLTEGMVLGEWPEAEWRSQVIEVVRD